jgi:hypothetical protein
MPDYHCPHYEDNERGRNRNYLTFRKFTLAFTVTLPHIELQKALSAGYRITHLHRAYEWLNDDDWDSNLFKGYIRKFLKIKYEASGWPEECLDKEVSEEVREERKKKFVDEANSKYGIVLDVLEMKQNPGLRYLAKLCLNRSVYLEFHF